MSAPSFGFEFFIVQKSKILPKRGQKMEKRGKVKGKAEGGEDRIGGRDVHDVLQKKADFQRYGDPSKSAHDGKGRRPIPKTSLRSSKPRSSGEREEIAVWGAREKKKKTEGRKKKEIVSGGKLGSNLAPLKGVRSLSTEEEQGGTSRL